MEFYLSSFGLHNPFITSELPEHGVYPIGIDSEIGIDLDYTSLLLGNKYYIDKYAYDYIIDSQNTNFLSPMAITLKTLNNEGYLELIDVKEIIKSNNQKVENMVNSLSKDYLTWLEIIRNHWKIIKDYYIEFHMLYGTKEKSQINTAFFPVYNYLSEIGQSDNTKKYNELIKIYESSRKNFKSTEIEEIIQISKPLLGQVVINDLIHDNLGSPILNWNDSRPYYDKLEEFRWRNSQSEIDLVKEAKKLFEVVVPTLKPNNIKEVIKFISNKKAVKSLRYELKLCLENNEHVSKDWLINYQKEILSNNLATSKKLKRFRWIGAAIGTFVPGSSLLQEALIEVGSIAAEDGIELTNKKRDTTWYLTLQSDK